MWNDRVIHIVPRVFVLRALLIQAGDLVVDECPDSMILPQEVLYLPDS